MSILRKALGAFVELEEKPQAPPTDIRREGVVRPDHAARTTTGPLAPAVPPAMVIEKFEAHFDKLFEDSNLPGPDYFEWSKSLDELESDIPEETARMRVAFKTLKVQGLTKENLLKTAAQYKVIVESDRVTMRAEVQRKQDVEIAPLERKVVEADSDVQETENQIALLQNSLAAKRKAAADAAQAIVVAREKLGTNIQGYEAACAAMIAHIEQDITKITNTL